MSTRTLLIELGTEELPVKALPDLAASFADGMALEHARSSQANRAVTPDAVAQRREAVQARGRQQ